jgi:hypothetical protein
MILRSIILKVNQYPKNFTVKNDSVCAGSKANLRASSDIGTVTWYTQATGGSPVYSGKVFQTNILSSDTLFYAQAGNNGCNISPRLEVRALVGSDFAPQEPVISPDTIICLSSGGIVTLKAVANSGLTVRWYDVSSGGSSINTGNSFSFQPTKREVKTFYVDAFNGVCGSTREAVNVTIEDHPVITGIYADTVCKGDSTYVGFNLPFGEAYWYDDASAGNMFFVGDRFAALPDITTTYYIQTASDICVSPSRIMITALVNTFPAVTKLWGDTICSKNKATLTCRYSGPGEVNWYESDTSSEILGSGNKFITPVIEGGKRYFAQTNYAGCYGPKMAVQPMVKATPFSGFSFEVLTWQQLRVSPINAPNTTIRWDFGDGFTSTANKVTHRYEQPGSYEVKLILTSTITGCKDSTTVTILIETSSVNGLAKLPAASLYPVPASLVLNVKSSILGSGKQKADIYSSTGALVFSLEAEARDGIMIIPVAALAPGIYILRMEGLAAHVFTKE